MSNRRIAATIVASASVLVGIAVNEGYSDKSYQDSVGVATIGFGQADGVKMGQKTDPVRALITLENSIDSHAKGMTECIKVPITQNEYDAYLDFTYNVGVGAFCKSTLLKKLNDGDYGGACRGLLDWNRAGGTVLPGLTKRRQQEVEKCSAS